ncbi:MAG: 50S ribosomal protein L3 [bacterium]
MKFIIGKKIEMTQIWQGEKVIAATKVQAGPCAVTQVKSEKKDGYEAVQIGFEEKNKKNIKKPQIGHLKKSKMNLRHLREFRCETKNLKIGDVITANTFEIGDVVKAEGISKGKGFQGGVKRHHFHGHNATHGTKDQERTGGSIGAGGPQHVFKGLRMPGRMGNAQATVSNLKIVKIDEENNILYIGGAVPGARNGLILISGKGDLKIVEPKVEPKVELKIETENQTV